MSGELLHLGITHKTAPVAVRERIYAHAAQLQAVAEACRNVADEHVVLSTCGRLELYAVADQVCVDDWIRGLSESSRLPLAALLPHVDVKRGDRCAEHLLRVAAGVESQIVGEPQILAQVRKAYLGAAENGTLGPILSALFRAAIHTGRRVRRETDIGASPHSFPSRAIQRIEDQMGSISSRSVVVVGAGALAADVVAILAARRPTHIFIANRDVRRGERLAHRFRATALPLAQLPGALAHADAVIVCTASPTYLIDKASFASRRSSETVVIDLAMPRNVHPNVTAIPGVHLTHMDALTATTAVERSALIDAERIITEQLDRFRAWRRGRHVAPFIQQLLRHAHHDDPVVARRRKRALHHPIMQLKNGIAA